MRVGSVTWRLPTAGVTLEGPGKDGGDGNLLEVP